MTEKEQFIANFKARTKKFAVDIIKFCNSLKTCKASAVVTYQLVKSATSVGANYRAACRARSEKEFYSKICIVVEEADESLYWLEVIEASELAEDIKELKRLLPESEEILKVVGKTKDTLSKKTRIKNENYLWRVVDIQTYKP